MSNDKKQKAPQGREAQVITKDDVATVEASTIGRFGDTTAMTTTGTTALQSADDYGDDMVPIGQVAPGYENQTSQDSSVPFIGLLQALSKVVQEKTVPGAESGMFIHSITKRLWRPEEGVRFVPATTNHEFVEWVPLKQGGGLVDRHAIDSEVVAKAKAASKEFGEYSVPDGKGGMNDLVETYYIFGVLFEEDGGIIGPAILSFKSTGIKAYKNLIAQMRAFTVEVNGQKFAPPLYAHTAIMTATNEKFGEGYAYVTRLAPLKGTVKESLITKDDPRFVMAKAFKKLIETGEAKVDYSQQVDGGPEKGSKDIPF